MSLPSTIYLPDDPVARQNQLERAYEDLSFYTNGDLKEWVPTLSGSSTEGSGTYTYQYGLYLLQSQCVDVWLDLAWSAHTGTGDMVLSLPFTVYRAPSSRYPFCGLVEDSSLDYSAGYSKLVLRALPGQMQAALIQTGDNVAALALPMDTAGTLRAHIRYLRTLDR